MDNKFKCKIKNYKTFKENHRRKSSRSRLGKAFLYLKPKTQSIKEETGLIYQKNHIISST